MQIKELFSVFFNFGPFYLNYEGFEKITESKNGLKRGPNP